MTKYYIMKDGTCINLTDYVSGLKKEIETKKIIDSTKKAIQARKERERHEKEILYRNLFKEIDRVEQKKAGLKNYSDLLRNFEKAYITGNYEGEMLALAKSVVYSVLKKVIDVSHNETLVNLRYELINALTELGSLQELNQARQIWNEKEKEYEYNKDVKDGFYTLSRQTLGDGLDLVNVACIALLEECKKIDTTQENFLEIPYIEKRLKKKVWIKKEDSKGGFEIAEIVPIRNVYIAVRRYIDSSRAVKVDASNGYSYIEDVTSITDTDGNEIKSDIYLRSNKYADLGGNTVNFNGVFTSYTMDNVSYEKQEKCIDALNLSGVQAKILKLRLEGYGYESIATYLGVKNGTVMKNMERIQKKAIDVYKLGDVMLSKKETSKKKLTENDKNNIVLMYENSGRSMEYIAKHFSVSKMTISRIVNGRKDR